MHQFQCRSRRLSALTKSLPSQNEAMPTTTNSMISTADMLIRYGGIAALSRAKQIAEAHSCRISSGGRC